MHITKDLCSSIIFLPETAHFGLTSILSRHDSSCPDLVSFAKSHHVESDHLLHDFLEFCPPHCGRRDTKGVPFFGSCRKSAWLKCFSKAIPVDGSEIMANYLGCWQKSFWTERKKRLMLKLLCSQISSIVIHYLQLRNLETIQILTETLKTVHTVHCGRLSLGKWLVLHQTLKIMNFRKLLLYYPLPKISDLTSPWVAFEFFSLEKTT